MSIIHLGKLGTIELCEEHGPVASFNLLADSFQLARLLALAEYGLSQAGPILPLEIQDNLGARMILSQLPESRSGRRCRADRARC